MWRTQSALWTWGAVWFCWYQSWGTRGSRPVACDSSKFAVTVKKGSGLQISVRTFCADGESTHTICWQEKTDLYLQSLKVVFQEREHTSFSPPNPCSINSSWQAERTLIAGDEGEAAAGWRQDQWHRAKSFIKRIIASTWQSVKCLFSCGFSF